MLEQNGDGGLLWKSLWPCLGAVDVIRVRVTAKTFNDAKMYGRHSELFFFFFAANLTGIHTKLCYTSRTIAWRGSIHRGESWLSMTMNEDAE